MKLFYRGVSYECDLSQVSARNRDRALEDLDSNFLVNYRGVNYLASSEAESARASVEPTICQMSYRGTTYKVNGSLRADVRGVFQNLALVGAANLRQYLEKIFQL
jgi:hypothetical protein